MSIYIDIGAVVISLISLATVIATRFNDITHLQKSVDEIKTDIKDFFDKVDKAENRLTAIETKCEERYK